MSSVAEMPPTPLPYEGSRRQLRTVQQFCQEYPAFTPGGIRWLLFHRHTNGLERAVVQVGRRVLLDVDRFFGWVDVQNGHGENAYARDSN